MKFTDRAELKSKLRLTKDGYGITEVRCARTGIQQYLGVELGLPTMDVINVYRPESEVFNKDSLATYAHKPVTDDHPSEMVNADNWTQLAKGDIGEDIVRDGDFVKVPLKLMDSELIRKIDKGKAEVSMGYMADIDFVDGVTPDGEPYQAVQRNIQINHLAVVDRGRAGSDCGFKDASANWGTSPINRTVIGDNQMTTQKVMVDGLTVETTEQGAQAINKLMDAKTQLEKQLSDKEAASQAVIDAKDAEIAKLDAEIIQLKESQLTDAEIDAKVKERAELINKAQVIAKDADFTGLSADEIKAAAVKAVLGDAVIDGKSAAYIDARFDVLLEDTQKDAADPFVDSMKQKPDTQITDNGQSEYEQRLANAWKEQA